MLENKPFIIDVGQSVTIDHPMAREWLRRDVENICHYFNHLGVETDSDQLYSEITSKAEGD